MSRHTEAPGLRATMACWLAACSLLQITSGNAQDGARDVITIEGRAWSMIVGDGPTAWSEAEAFCDTLESGGFTDWRLPTLLELESLHDPNLPRGIPGEFALPDCCAWSRQSLADLPADRKGDLPDPGGSPDNYYWGLMFDGGIRYYANGRFTDGFALCTRDVQEP